MRATPRSCDSEGLCFAVLVLADLQSVSKDLYEAAAARAPAKEPPQRPGKVRRAWDEVPRTVQLIYNACNSGSERDLTADVGWTPTLHQKIDSAGKADREVARGAGPGRIR